MLATFLLVPAMILFHPSAAYAKGGKLKSFEKKLEKKKAEPSRTYRSCPTCPAGSSTYETPSMAEAVTRSWWDIITLFMMAGVGPGLAEGMSWGEYYSQLKASGNPALPTIKVEGSYQYIVNHIHGYDATATFGYLMFGADCNVWHLFESNPDDQLKFISPHVMARFIPFPFLEVDLSFGTKIIVGDNTHYGFEAGLPAYIFITKNFIWDVKTYGAYINQTDLWDVSSGLSFKIKYFGIRAGYRMIELDGSYTHGPQVGLFGQW